MARATGSGRAVGAIRYVGEEGRDETGTGPATGTSIGSEARNLHHEAMFSLVGFRQLDGGSKCV